MIGMKANFRRAAVIAALALSGFAGATTAEASDRYRHDGGDEAAVAIGAGLVGLAIGAVLADRDDRYYNDSRRYYSRRYVRVSGYPDYYYYYPENPRRYYRDRYYDRYYDRYDRHWRDGRNHDRWDRHGDRWGSGRYGHHRDGYRYRNGGHYHDGSRERY